MSIPIANSGQRACPACSHVAAAGRRFCGRCRAVLVRPCSGCGFANDLDDCWCGGCARAIAPCVDRPAAAQAHAAVIPVPRATVASTPDRVASAPDRVASTTPDRLPALLLAINRGDGNRAAIPADLRDQDQLDALFEDRA